ncbi:alpha/beta hydrolase [Polyangium sp. y55x31]|uniref:alpha/beta fold hydrolase n=1 Tax=Polyangium sp. y55x31 TaxID=3042688 RepID=UPI002482EE22|nr:alpha/beta hydrolase [Polyangium sp. y55x31]MDI1482474.1 alpha/beta hydrolase [Polyangium sp. y55x31]
MTTAEFFTARGVRLRRRAERPGDLNWLFLPGGPGIGSESLHELADALDVPGAIWMVDLPGDGSNVAPPGAPANPFETWPQVLLEAASALPNCVYAGHSTGGMYLLSVPELEAHIVGLALLSSAPDAGWRSHFFEMTKRNPLPEVDAASRRYEAEKTNERLRDVAVASAEWNFTPESVEIGRELLGRMPYNFEAVDWSDRAFDESYVSRWWPRTLPTLIVSGAEDRIVWQALWDRPEFQGRNVLRRTVEGAAHFPWIERPEAVRSAFQELAARILQGR